MIAPLLKVLKFFEDRRRIYELLVGLFLLLLTMGIASAKWLEPIENMSLDMRFRLRGERPFLQPIVLVGIDEPSLDKLGHWPWTREKHAALVDFLNRKSFRPAMIAYDVLFENKDPLAPLGDTALAKTVKEFEGSVMMPYFYEKGRPSRDETEEAKEKRLETFAVPVSNLSVLPEGLEIADKVSVPYTELAEASELAFANAPIDRDGKTRRARLIAKYKDKIYPSMTLWAALRYLGADLKDVRIEKCAIVIEKSKVGRKVIPIDVSGDMLINYYGNIPELKAYSFVYVLNAAKTWMSGGKLAQDIKEFKDKIVLVGATAMGIYDRRTTPFFQYEYGIRIQAQVIANILSDHYLVRVDPAASYAAIFLTGLLAILLTMLLKINRSLPSVIGLMVAYFFGAHLIFLRGTWIDAVAPEVGIVLVFIGITSFRYFTALEELKRTQEQLIQSAKMASLGQLSAGIAHEFRNILNAVNLHVEYCARPGVPPERVTKYLGVIKQIMDNANLILNGLLTFARKNESVKKPGNLKKTVEDTLLLIEKEMLRHQITVKTELEEVAEVSYDTGQISQVVMNLMNNARDALKDREGKEITLRTKNVENGVQLDIGDNGSGIPPQVLKRLFEPFVTSKPAGKGTGLGLSVCHGIIRNHGGDIKVTTAKDQGTTWHIFLPKT